MVLTTAAGPTSAELAADWTFRPWVVLAIVLAAALYPWGVALVLRRERGNRWPMTRVLSFLAGLGVIAVPDGQRQA